jgi:hypothetical protein
LQVGVYDEDRVAREKRCLVWPAEFSGAATHAADRAQELTTAAEHEWYFALTQDPDPAAPVLAGWE